MNKSYYLEWNGNHRKTDEKLGIIKPINCDTFSNSSKIN